MSYLYRCKKTIKNGALKGETCDTRSALSRKVEEYIRKPKCKTCGAELIYMDKWQRKKNRENTCKCDGLMFPHRKGCKWCNSYEGEYTEDELRERNFL